jgi:hypothetical protein
MTIKAKDIGQQLGRMRFNHASAMSRARAMSLLHVTIGS